MGELPKWLKWLWVGLAVLSLVLGGLGFLVNAFEVAWYGFTRVSRVDVGNIAALFTASGQSLGNLMLAAAVTLYAEGRRASRSRGQETINRAWRRRTVVSLILAGGGSLLISLLIREVGFDPTDATFGLLMTVFIGYVPTVVIAGWYQFCRK